MPLLNVRDIASAENDGATWFTTWRKTPTQTTGSGIWFDLSMSPGNPTPNYYAAAPNIAAALRQSTDGGLAHGGDVSQFGMRKYLKQVTALTVTATAVPLPMLLCDYLMYYPFVDMSVTDDQPMTNGITLPRYASGKGVQIMPVEVAGQSGSGNPRFMVKYTNQDGATNWTPPVACNTQVVNGTIITSSTNTFLSSGPFLPLAPGDTGVRNVQSVQFLSSDVGLIAFVLVMPIENTSIRTIDAPVERNMPVDFAEMPSVADDAYLNLICCPNGTLANAPIHGTAQFIWA